MITIFHASKLFQRRRARGVFALLAIALVSLALPLGADPAPSLDQLEVLDQGSHLTFLWHFYPKQLPPHLMVRELHSASLSLADRSSLALNLPKLAAVAFTLTLDGHPAPLSAISELTLAPDGGCLATLVFPGKRGATVQLTANLMPYYPSSYIMNYQIYSPLHKDEGVAGYFAGGTPAEAVTYHQAAGTLGGNPDAGLDAPAFRLFKAELKVPWVNVDWIVLVMILLLTQPLSKSPLLGAVFLLEWGIICGFSLPARAVPLPAFAPPLLTALLAVLVTLRGRWSLPLFLGGAGLAALLNSLADRAEIPTPARDQPLLNLSAVAGFGLSLLVVFAIGSVLIGECRKYPHFQKTWVPKICWALAVFSLFLAVRTALPA